jgi:predicted DNA-binding transcriptional regulator YafY
MDICLNIAPKVSPMLHDSPSLAFIARAQALIDALGAGPLQRPDLLARVREAYPQVPDSARRMIDRDITFLAQLGVRIDVSRTRPPIYTLYGGTPAFNAAALHTLALVRDSFGDHHPQAAQIHVLLNQLIAGLRPDEHAQYAQRQATRAPLQPAIDYTPYAALIARLELAISARELLRLRYRTSQGHVTTHRKVEPYEIEYYERHFYLVAYSHNSRQIHDFRVDRVEQLESLMRRPPGEARPRQLIIFRYRLAATLAQGEISQRFEQQRVVETLPNGDVIVEAHGRSDFFIVRTLLKYAGSAELLWPEELREKMAEEVRGLAAMYRDTC